MDTGLFGSIYRGSEWIMRLAYLNILWIAFSLMGLVVFGLFPATVSMFAVTRKWVMGDTEIPIFKTFWASYKTEFKQANIVGYIILVIGFFLYFDFLFDQSHENFFGYFCYFFVCLFFFYLVIALS